MGLLPANNQTHDITNFFQKKRWKAGIISGILLFFVVALPVRTQAQDPVFSQFYAAPLQLNPAFAGVTLAPRISANYRNQWAGFSGGFNTAALSFETWAPKLNSGFGLFLMSDRAIRGIYNTIQFNGTYSYQVRISNKTAVRFGVQGGLVARQLDWEKLVFGDQLNPISGPADPNGNPIPTSEIPPESLNRAFFDLGVGVLFYTNKLYAGFSANHINSPDESFYPVSDGKSAGLPLRYSVHAGYEFDIGNFVNGRSEAYLAPSVMFIRQSDIAQVNVGSGIGFRLFYGGLWYRHTLRNSDAVIFLAGVRAGILRFGYSYDLTVSGLGVENSGGSHEVSFTLNFAESKKARKRRKTENINDCFRIFE